LIQALKQLQHAHATVEPLLILLRLFKDLNK